MDITDKKYEDKNLILNLEEKLILYKEYEKKRRPFDIFERKEHWFIKIPKPRYIIQSIRLLYKRLRYKPYLCCDIMPIGKTHKDWYLYCSLAIWDSKNNSQRHNLQCPSKCDKCKDEHQDLLGRIWDD